jgi:hypothetical protein
MVAGVRQLEIGLKGRKAGPALGPDHVLTDLRSRALQENIRLVINKTIPAVKSGAGRKSLQNQLANPRFRYIDQVPEARAALTDALKGTGVSLP